MKKRNILALIFTILSLALLFPGLTEPILSIVIAAELPIIGLTTFYEQTQSILQTVDTLYSTNNKLVAVLIFLFSVVVPVLKGGMMMIVLLVKDNSWKAKIHKFMSIIGKWSMADVFVVGVLMAFLSTQSNSAIQADLLDGFYYFVAYCLVSLVAIQIADVSDVELPA